MKRIIFTILLAFCITFSAQAQKPEQIYKKAVAEYNKGEFEEAVESFDKLLKQVQDYVSYYYRGMSHLAIGNYNEAQNDFSMAIALKQDYADAYNGRALTFGYLNNVEAAMLDFKKAIELDPNFAEAYANRATAYISQNLFELAEKDLRKALALRKDHIPAQLNLARLTYSMGSFKAAIKEFNKCIALGVKDSPEVYIKRGKSYLAIKEVDKAIKDFNEAIKLEPRDPNIYLARATAYERQGKKELAKKDIKEASYLSGAHFKPFEEIKFEKYTSPDKVFTLTLPEGWFSDELARDDDVTEYIYTKFPRGTNDMNNVMVTAAIVRNMPEKYDVEGDAGIINFWDGSIGKNVMQYAHHEVVQQVQKVKNGLPTRLYKSTVQYTENTPPMITYEYAVATKTDLAYLVLRCPAKQFIHYEKIFDQIIDKLEIKW